MRELYAEFMRSVLTVGARAGLKMNPDNHIQIKRLNKKTVSDEAGELWGYDELLPFIDGKSVLDAALQSMIRQWHEKREGTP